MKSSLEIAQDAVLKPIEQIAEELGLEDEEFEPYGRHKAKIDLGVLERMKEAPNGKLVCVTGMTPTKAGEGKTTTLVGLTQGLGVIGKSPVACLREPSLGPVFGIKGGAAGGGMTQVVPMEDLNLHFTGDIHAIGAANNLLAAMLDASILHGNPLHIDALSVGWRRAMDMNDRALRQIVVALGGRANGYPRESGFDITAASEVMAIMAVARDLQDLRRRLGAITVAQSFNGRAPITAEDLGAAGAMAVLLKDALKPNLIQTLEGQPCLMHCGPFANIAHGNNSLVADLIGMKLGDYVVTESGFGSDMGAEKFFDIVCRFGGLSPSAAVLVTTVRAIKHHGGIEDDPRTDRARGRAAIEAGMANVRRHLANIKQFGLPCVVAVNRRPGDTNEEVDLVKRLALEAGAFRAEANDGLRQGRDRRGRPRLRGRRRLRRAQRVPHALRGRLDHPGQDRGHRPPRLRCRRRLLLSRGGEEDRPVQRRRPGPVPDLHGQDAPVALRGPRAAQRARELQPPGARHPRLHRRGLARAAVRRHHADAGPGHDAGGAQRRHRRERSHGRAVLSPRDNPAMSALADRSLGQLLEQVASESPSPGGGSSCALACALAAGLVEMAAAFTLSRAEYAERHERMAAMRERAGELRAQALELAERELSVYGAVLDALREPEDAPGRTERLDAALSDAADSPLAVARAAAEVAGPGRRGRAHRQPPPARRRHLRRRPRRGGVHGGGAAGRDQPHRAAPATRAARRRRTARIRPAARLLALSPERDV